MKEKEMNKDLTTISTGDLQTKDTEYVRLVSLISDVWEKAILAVNTELLEANRLTGRYIVEFQNVRQLSDKDLPQVGAGISQQVAANIIADIIAVPWGHHVRIIDKCKNDSKKALFRGNN